MTRRPALLAALLLGLAPAAVGQPADRPAPRLPPGGTELYRGLFHYRGVSPVTEAELRRFDRNDYRDLIVVVHGEPPRARTRGGSFDATGPAAKALKAGGAVVIAAEEKADLKDYFPDETWVEVTGDRVYCPDPVGTRTLGGRPECPFVRPEPPSVKALLELTQKRPLPDEWRLFNGLKRVATNSPSSLRVRIPGTYAAGILASFTPDCRVQGANETPLPKDRAFAVAGAGTDVPSRCLILADPSVFTNQMMVAPAESGDTALGTDNLALANNVVQWVRGPQQRSRCLFVEAGTVREKFDDVRFDEMVTPQIPPLPPGAMPPPPDVMNPGVQRAMTDGINRNLARWEDSNGANRLLMRDPSDDRRFAGVAQVLAVVAAVVFCLWLIRRSWTARHTPDLTPVPTDTGRVAASGEPGSLARRKEEVLQAGQYTDVAREYLRGLFADQGLPAEPGRTMPKVTGRGARAVREPLRILWEVAYGPNPRPVTYARWKELEPMIDAVRQAAADGRWRFAGGPA